jgi:uncharacterized membrane protein YhaH (DUF805 family)
VLIANQSNGLHRSIYEPVWSAAASRRFVLARSAARRTLNIARSARWKSGARPPHSKELVMSAFNVWTWEGTIGRGRYLGSVFVLAALQHNLGRVLAVVYGYRWDLFNYVALDDFWIYPPHVDAVTWSQDPNFGILLLLLALPFIWAGVMLTLRRLRDVDWPVWLIVLYFLPLLNVIFFFILVVVPSTQDVDRRSHLSAQISRLIPESRFGSAVLGIVLTAALAAVDAALGASELGNYGWAVFVGIPFFLGLNSTLIYGFHRPRSIGGCLLVAVLSNLFVGLALFGFAVEGIICLVMAIPIAVTVGFFGGLVGYAIQRRASFGATTLRVASLSFVLMPALIVAEYALGQPAPLHEVKTSIIVKSDPETVWKHVVTFSQLPPPNEAMFKTGIAYPIRADMHGEGAGAVRYCVFSTGAFVEPITVWDEPRLLRFDVSDQPPTMEEWSFWSNVHPPHLKNYLLVQEGQFELRPLPDGTTLLEGTTWYRNRFWPSAYWHLWSDRIINTIHLRVLQHIKTLAEND